jgi:MinD-like ATPase involved in chromosome partitioning or flagellar assembly
VNNVRQNDKSGEQPVKGRVVSIVSAKGGSGKTLITATAAYLLTTAGKQVLVIDTDFSTRGLTLFLLGPESEGRTLVVQQENCLSDALIDKLPADQLKPRSFPRKGQQYNLILSSLRAFTSNTPDDRVLEARSTDFAREYFEYLKDVIAHFRQSYDYILIDTRGGYDFTSAAPALLSDEYVVVLEADQVSVNQVYGLKKRIEQWSEPYLMRPALGGFIVNKAALSVDYKPFGDALINIYGGVHYGTIPLDYEAVRAYQSRDIPMDSRPDCDFAYFSHRALERLFSPSLNWKAQEGELFERVGRQITTLWKARRLWEQVEKALPATVLIMGIATAISYLYVRNAHASRNLTAFFLSSALFVLTATFISAFVLLKSFYKWKINRFIRLGLGIYGLVAAGGLFWMTFIDVRHTFNNEPLLSRIQSQANTIAEQETRIAKLAAARDQLQFTLDDCNKLQKKIQSQNDIITAQQTRLAKLAETEKQLQSVLDDSNNLQKRIANLRGQLSGHGSGGNPAVKPRVSLVVLYTSSSVAQKAESIANILRKGPDNPDVSLEAWNPRDVRWEILHPVELHLFREQDKLKAERIAQYLNGQELSVLSRFMEVRTPPEGYDFELWVF